MYSPLLFQILACVFVSAMQNGFCWVIQLFSLVCTVNGYYDRKCFADPQFRFRAIPFLFGYLFLYFG